MSLSWKYVRSHTQIVVLFRTEVVEQISVWLSRCILIYFNGKLQSLRIHLSRQIRKLTGISRILEEYHIVCIQAHGSREFVFQKQILRQIHDAHDSVMRTLGKQICHSLVRYLHQVVDNQQSRLSTVKVVQVCNSLMKEDSTIIEKQLLVLSVTVDYLARRWICHSRYIVYETKHESSIATRRRNSYDGNKRMSKRQHVVVVVRQIVLFIPSLPLPLSEGGRGGTRSHHAPGTR